MRRFWGIGAAALAAVLLSGTAHAQTTPGYRPAGESNLVAITSTASVPLQVTPFSTDALCTQVTVRNTGSVDFWVEAAATSAAAVPDIPAAGNPGTSTLVRAGSEVDLSTANKPYISAKTASGSSTLIATCSTGVSRGVGNGQVTIAGSSGSISEEGEVADGASAASTNPVVVGGVDGSGNAQSVLTDTSGRPQTVGAAADGAAVAGNPVLTAGIDGSGNTQTILTGTDGALAANLAQWGGNGVSGILANGNDGAGNAFNGPRVYSFGLLKNGSTWDAARTASIGNAVAATGIAAAAPYGEYLTNANQPAITTGQYTALMTDPAGNLRTAPQRPTATDILVGYATVTATTGTTTLITVSAGRTWVGTLCASVDGNKAAAVTGNGLVNATFLTTGTNVVPAAGTYFGVSASIGANAATGTVGTQGSNQGCTPFTTVAPAGNTTTINYVTTCTSTTACAVHVSAIGVMQ